MWRPAAARRTSPSIPTGRCVIVVTPDAERTVNTYLGVSSMLSTEDLDEEIIADITVSYDGSRRASGLKIFVNGEPAELKVNLDFIMGMGLAFGAWVWVNLGATSGKEYFTGFIVEKTLSMDNIFVISLIFSYFAIPRVYQHRVLFWGILGAIIMRAVFILTGVALVQKFAWIVYVFGAFLVITGIRMGLRKDDEVHPLLGADLVYELAHGDQILLGLAQERKHLHRMPVVKPKAQQDRCPNPEDT